MCRRVSSPFFSLFLYIHATVATLTDRSSAFNGAHRLARDAHPTRAHTDCGPSGGRIAPHRAGTFAFTPEQRSSSSTPGTKTAASTDCSPSSAYAHSAEQSQVSDDPYSFGFGSWTC